MVAKTVASRKAKGRDLQQYTAKTIAAAIQMEYGENGDVQSRSGGQNGTDVILTPEARRKFPFSVECKNQEKISLIEYIKQAKINSIPNTDWLVVLKNKNLPYPVVTLDFHVFMNMQRKLLEYEKELGYKTKVKAIVKPTKG